MPDDLIALRTPIALDLHRGFSATVTHVEPSVLHAGAVLAGLADPCAFEHAWVRAVLVTPVETVPSVALDLMLEHGCRNETQCIIRLTLVGLLLSLSNRITRATQPHRVDLN